MNAQLALGVEIVPLDELQAVPMPERAPEPEPELASCYPHDAGCGCLSWMD